MSGCIYCGDRGRLRDEATGESVLCGCVGRRIERGLYWGSVVLSVVLVAYLVLLVYSVIG
jgi:hypothetical protein